MLRLAHRGDWRQAPENTIAAFRAALAVPDCDGVELDVRLAADGTPVVIHDDTLSRVQGRPDRVDGLDAPELVGAGVPPLRDVFAALPRSAFVDVELKVDAGAAAIEVLAGVRGPGLDGAVVSSFDPVALETVRRLAPAWPCWLIAEDLAPATITLARDLGCAAVAAHWRAIDEPAMTRAGGQGLAVAAWTVRRRPTERRLARLGVVAVCVEGAALDAADAGATQPEGRA